MGLRLISGSAADAGNRDLRAWHIALADREYAPAKTMLLSSSSGESSGATAWDRGYYQVFRDRLRARHATSGVTGGRGFLPAYLNHSSHAAPLTASSGTVDATQHLGYGLKSANLANGTHSVTGTFTGTGADIVYSQYSGGGSFTYTVDGGAATTVNTASATLDRFKRVSITGLANASHTVTVTWAAGGSVFIRGMCVYNGDEDKGIHFYNGGKAGVTADTYASNLAQWQYAVTAVQPNLVILDLGRNEENAQLGSAFMRSRIQAVIDGVRANCTSDPAFVQILFPEVGGITAPVTEPHSAYEAAWRDVASSDPKIALLDLTLTMASPLSDNSRGLFNTDKAHPTDRGHAFIAEQLLRLLAF